MPYSKMKRWVLVGGLGLAACQARPSEPSAPASQSPSGSEEPTAPGGQTSPSSPVQSSPTTEPTPSDGGLPPDAGTPLDAGTPVPTPPSPPTSSTPPPEGCLTQETRPVQWVRSVPGSVRALATDTQARILLFARIPGGEAPQQFDPRGQLLWSGSPLSWRVDVNGASVAPSTGSIYAWGSHMNEATDFSDGAAYRLDALGQQATLLSLGGDETVLGPYFEDAQGNVLALRSTSFTSDITYTGHDGTHWSLHSFHGDDDAPGVFHYLHTAFDAQGNVVVLALLNDTLLFQGQTFGTPGQLTTVVMKLSPQGELLWARQVSSTPHDTQPQQIGVASSGQVLVLGRFAGTLDWPTGPLHATASTGFLFSLDAEGRPGWIQLLSGGESYDLAVSASGASLVSGTTHDSSSGQLWMVREYSPEGCMRWTQSWPMGSTPGRFNTLEFAWSGEDPMLAGSFQGTVSVSSDSGQPPLSSDTPAGFVLKLGPP